MSRVTTGVRWRRLAIPGAVLVALTTVLGPAWADPEDRLRDAEEHLDDAEQELHHSTKELADATEAYEAATDKLPAAEERLHAAEDRLAAAEDAHRAAEEAVDAARHQAKVAQERLAEAQQKVADQVAKIEEVTADIGVRQDSISQVATSAYQRGAAGDLAMVMAALQSDSLSEYATAMKAKQSVVESESVVLDKLRSHRAVLANERVVLEELREVAEQRKHEAEQKLDEARQREAEAREAKAAANDAAQAAAAAKAEVDHLIQARETAMHDAKAAKAADAAEYEKWKAERRKIQEEIERIERERREAEADRSGGSGGGGSDGGGSSDGGSSDSSSSGLSYPVSNPYVTSPYGMRVHPITGIYKLHDGTDFRAYCGTPIRAAISGNVEWAMYRGGYGNQVAVSGGRYVTTYSHLSRFAVSPGENVSRGEVIGYSGTTGWSTACHLHFMLYVNGVLSNPMSYL